MHTISHSSVVCVGIQIQCNWLFCSSKVIGINLWWHYYCPYKNKENYTQGNGKHGTRQI